MADLYDKQISAYRNAIEEDPESALKRFGVSLLNSLNPAERALIMKKLGMDSEEAVDIYNLGVHHAQQENWTEAIRYFDSAREKDPKMCEAVYNLAICSMHTGHTDLAKRHFQSYIDCTSNVDEQARVKKMLEEIE